MTSSTLRAAAAAMAIVLLAACTPAVTAPGQPSSSDVNPITGARGGTNGR